MKQPWADPNGYESLFETHDEKLAFIKEDDEKPEQAFETLGNYETEEDGKGKQGSYELKGF